MGVETLQKALIYGIREICNADQGSQFTGTEWVQALTELNIQISHDGVGRCIDNVRIERFWRTIKYEDVHLKQYQTLKEARIGIGDFINHYNYQRPHQALNYARPADAYFAKEAPDQLFGLPTGFTNPSPSLAFREAAGRTV